MEEELHYSTVVFKNNDRAPKETNEDSTIYSTVKSEKGTVNTVPKTNEDSTIYSTVKSKKGTGNTVPTEAAAHPHHFCLLVVCLGIFCVIILVSISAIIYINVIINKEKENSEAKLGDLFAEKQQLIRERSILQKDIDNLNRTLRVILKFDTFPVNLYCPQKKCQPCQKGWIQFQEKCYLFYEEGPRWKTWTQSLQYCQNYAADLVVIDSLQEQEFVSNHTKFYYDKEHGYWLGLNQTADQNWRWIDGRNDTLMYWIKGELGTPGPCALMIPDRNYTANWDPADCIMENKLICESEALIRSNQKLE